MENQVKQMWRAEQQKKKLADVATQVFDMVKNGEEGKIATLGHFERDHIKGTRKAFEKYPADVIQDVFMQQTGAKNAMQNPFANGFV